MLVPAVRNDRTPSRALGARAVTAKAAPALGPPDEDAVALAAEQRAFNHMLAERAELQRESNAIQDLAVEQMKRDDQLMRAMIKMI
jgi:hypothetical protein